MAKTYPRHLPNLPPEPSIFNKHYWKGRTIGERVPQRVADEKLMKKRGKINIGPTSDELERMLRDKLRRK